MIEEDLERSLEKMLGIPSIASIWIDEYEPFAKSMLDLTSGYRDENADGEKEPEEIWYRVYAAAALFLRQIPDHWIKKHDGTEFNPDAINKAIAGLEKLQGIEDDLYGVIPPQQPSEGDGGIEDNSYPLFTTFPTIYG